MERRIESLTEIVISEQEKAGQQFERQLVPNREWQDRWFKLERVSADVAQMMDRVEIFVKRCYLNRPGRRLLVICGENGVGKSAVAKAAWGYIWRVGALARRDGYWDTPFEAMKAKWSDVAAIEPKDRDGVWRDYVRAGLLILDDVGSEVDQYKSGRPLENLRLMLDARENKWTLITTNIMPERWPDTWDLRVTDRLMRGADEPVVMREAISYAVQKTKGYRQPHAD